MTPKKVTDATKAKLPLPKGHPQARPKRKRPKGTAPTFEAVPFSFEWVDKHRLKVPGRTLNVPPLIPAPDPKAYPWPLRFAWWIDGWLAKMAQRFQ